MRVQHLDAKLFWQDEAVAALRVSGHTVAEYQRLFDGRSHRAPEMAAMQRLAPGRGVAATIASIAAEEPQRSPLYYGLARLWAGTFGDGPATLRGFSAFLGIAGVGLAFWFGRELTRSHLGGAILAALVAVSPFHVRYSQQLREFVLLADCTLLAGALFVRAIVLPAPRRWMLFALAAVLGLYSSPQFVFVLAGFGVLAAWTRSRVTAVGFAGAAAAAAAAYGPWLWVTLRSASLAARGLDWAAGPYSPRAFAIKWTFNLGAVFFDAELAYAALGVMLLPVFGFVIYALVRVLRDRNGLASGVTLVLLFATSLPLIAADVVRRAHYETVARYEVVTWLGIEAAAALALTALLGSASRGARILGVAFLAYLVFCGILGTAVGAKTSLWWDNNEHVDEARIARSIPPKATVVAERTHAVNVLVLSRYIAPTARLLLVDFERVENPVRAVPPAYVFLPSRALAERIAADCAGCAGGKRARLVNVSPAMPETVPRLDSAGSGDVVPGNALWRIVLPPAPSHSRAR